MKTTTIVLSKTELELIDGKWHHKILSRTVVDTEKSQPWEARASELRHDGKKWREIADILNDEGFTTKQGHRISAGQILNRKWYVEKK